MNVEHAVQHHYCHLFSLFETEFYVCKLIIWQQLFDESNQVLLADKEFQLFLYNSM